MPKSKRSGGEQRAPTQTPAWWGLGFSLILTLGLGMGSGLVQAGRVTIPFHLQVIALVSAGAVGLLVGLISRLALRHWIGVLRFLSAVIALLLWMATAEVAYMIGAGLQPAEYLAGFDTWLSAGQLAIGCLSILAMGLAGQRVRGVSPVQASRGHTVANLRTPVRWGLSLSLGLAVVLGLGMGFLQANVGRLVFVPPLALPLTGAGMTGLLVGLLVRLTLRGHTETLKALLALAALLLWLVAAEVTYAVWSGLQPLHYLSTANDWIELGQLAIGIMAAIVGGVVRRPPLVPVEVVPAKRRQKTRASRKARKVRSTARAARERPRRALHPKLGLPTHAGEEPAPANTNSEVKVIAKDQDRCPYCLDVIEPRDPRGVVVCEICGTPHHADCWAAGGRCQMPHLVT